MATAPESIEAAIALIQAAVPCRLVAYLGDQGIPAIGYGLSRYASGAVVCLGDITSPPIARAEMIRHLRDVVAPWAERLPGWADLGVRRQAALLCFMQGVGTAVLRDSRCAGIVAAMKDGEDDPAALDRVAKEMQRFVTDVLGTVKPALAERRKREAELWMSEARAMIRLRALQDTFLKRAPIDSDYLSDAGRRAIKKGATLEATELIEISQDSHDWVVPKGEKERWAIFTPHWEQPDSELRPDPSGVVNWSDFNALVGQYITVGEMLRYDSRRRPTPGSQAEKNLKRLAAEFDAIRKAWGGPIMVTSAYRPEPINSQVGGVPNSRHVSGEAIDVYPANGDLDGFYRWIRRRWSGGLGDGRNRGFVHLDMRENGRFHPRGAVEPAATWLY